MTVISIINRDHGIIHKNLEETYDELKIRGRIKTIQSTTKISQETWKDLEKNGFHPDSSKKTLVRVGVKNL